ILMVIAFECVRWQGPQRQVEGFQIAGANAVAVQPNRPTAGASSEGKADSPAAGVSKPQDDAPEPSKPWFCVIDDASGKPLAKVECELCYIDPGLGNGAEAAAASEQYFPHAYFVRYPSCYDVRQHDPITTDDQGWLAVKPSEFNTSYGDRPR